MTQQSTLPSGEKIRFLDASTDPTAESEDSAWEDDEDDVDRLRNGGIQSPTSISSARQTLKHKRRSHLVNRRNDRTQQTSLPTTPPKVPRQRYILPSTDVLLDGTQEFIVFTIRYVWDILSRAFHHSRYMLGFLLALWIIALITLRISSTLWGAVAPVCYLPIISSSRLCETLHKDLSAKQAPQWADYPKMIDLQSKTFEQLMDESIGGSALTIEVKRAEMAITDLVSFVRLSKLKAKDTLARSLIEFVQDAKKTGRGLQRLSSKIGGAVDK